MIVSTNSTPGTEEFNSLLEKTVSILASDAKKNEDKYIGRSPKAFEKDVYNLMNKSAKGSNFEGTIVLFSSSYFPDIVANKFYGVEVKTKSKDSWTTLGNSVFEGTRIESVNRIFLLFGKLANPVEFKFKPYEDCISDVKVTHSPRYTIDMDLEVGDTIFDKMGVSYNDLRKKETLEIIKPIRDYYHSQLKTGEELWWLESENEQEELISSNIAIRFWGNLKMDLKAKIRNQVFALFPEVFSRSQTKYKRIGGWLVVRHSILSTSLRDTFSAGGKVTLIVKGDEIQQVPKVFKHLQDNVGDIISELINLPIEEIHRYWGDTYLPADYESATRRMETWIDMVIQQSASLLEDVPLCVEKLIREQMNT